MLSAAEKYGADPSDTNGHTFRAQAHDLFDPEWARDLTANELEAFIAAVFQRGASEVAQQVGLAWDVIEPDVLLAISNRLEALSEKVTATTLAVLESNVLLQGVADGESINQLVVRIRAIFSDLSTWRAQMIARTETTGGFTHASILAAERSDVVTSKEWLSTDDTRTRDTHVALDGVVVHDLRGVFPNGCVHPGDPLGPPSEVVNCRCSVIFGVDEDDE